MTAIYSATPSLRMPGSISNLASFSDSCVYNDLRGGRVGAFLTASLHYEHTNEQNLVPHMQRLFARLVEDAFFYGNALVWIAPPTEAIKRPLFTRNIGIYLGLWLVHTYLNQETSIPYILNAISFDIELREIPSAMHRKRIRIYLIEKTSSLSASDFQDLVGYYMKCKNPVVLESIICLYFKSGLVRVNAIVQQVEALLSETDSEALEFVRELQAVFADRYPVASFAIDLSTDLVATLIRNRFKSICQFCGDQFVETVLLNNLDKDELKPKEWLTLLQDRYPDRNILFDQIIRRERFLLEMPIHVFNDQTDSERFNYHLNFLKSCYQTDIDTLCTYRFRLDTSKFIHRFDTFCIKLLLPQDFAQLNHPLKVSYFRQYYKNIQFSLLLVKRHEKQIVWQGRSFTDNLEVDFLYFFMNDFHSINEYKTHFPHRKLNDTEVLEIFFWALELGIIKPAPSVSDTVAD